VDCLQRLAPYSWCTEYTGARDRLPRARERPRKCAPGLAREAPPTRYASVCPSCWTDTAVGSAEVVDHRYRTRVLPSHALYESLVHPEAHADAVLDTSDLSARRLERLGHAPVLTDGVVVVDCLSLADAYSHWAGEDDEHAPAAARNALAKRGRVTEVLRLRLSDLVEAEGALRLMNLKQRRRDQRLKLFYVGPDLLSQLRAFATDARLSANGFFLRSRPSGTKPMSYAQCWRLIRHYAAMANVQVVGADGQIRAPNGRDFRHGAATRCARVFR
jgi:integrase